MTNGDEPFDGAETFGAETFGAETARFSHEQLVACDECLRANPPTRLKCLYCGASLPETDESRALRRPTLRRLEEWESGFNVVSLPRAWGASKTAAVEGVASFLNLEKAALSSIASADRALPLARASSLEEASFILERLKASGFEALVIADEELACATPPRRARSLVIDDEFVVHGSDGSTTRLNWSHVVLLVTGRTHTRRVEVEERQKSLGARREVAETREFSDDEQVLDIYASDDSRGWRVSSKSFDYSCLGSEKALLVAENFRTLSRRLRERAVDATFDDGYSKFRHLLSAVWPAEEREESGGLRRERPGKFNAETVTVVNNEMQFTRYSRLRRRVMGLGGAVKR